MADIAKTTRIESIIDFALEDLSTWKAPQSLKSIGPVYPEAYKQFQDALDAFKVDLRTHLGFLTAAELEGDFPQTTTGALNMLFDPDGQVGFLARRLVRLKKTVPADYIGGWAIKGLAIDQAHWRGMSHFTLSEATMLSMGRDPRKTSYGPVMQHYGRSPQGDTILYFLEARKRSSMMIKKSLIPFKEALLNLSNLQSGLIRKENLTTAAFRDKQAARRLLFSF